MVLDQQTGQLLALKVMQPEIIPSKDNREMFLQQIGKTKTLNHPNIIQLLDYGYGNGIFFLMMEYCEGGTVADLMGEIERCLSGSEAISIILQTLTGLEYAHNTKMTLVHGDIKPSNIFFAQLGGSLVKLGDYGSEKPSIGYRLCSH